MKYLSLAEGKLNASQLVLGCMRTHQKSVAEADELLMTAVDAGVNYFDHADIYGGGRSEEVFGAALALHPGLREKIFIQTKCGIKRGEPTVYDLSKEYIIKAVEGSLARLQVEYIDTLLLHRPDALMDAEEIAAAFDLLYRSGKVRHFGISNMNAMQAAYLQKFSAQKLVFNQLQFNPVNAGMIDQGVNVNMNNTASIDHDGAVLDYCRMHDMTIQAWSILQAEGTRRLFLGDAEYQGLNDVLLSLAGKYQATPAAIVVAWILRHPAKIQPIVGTTDKSRLLNLCKAADITLTRQEWYEIYLSLGRQLP